MQVNTVSILGCGWLGLPLAESLIQTGFFVKGSTTEHDKINSLQEAGIHPFCLRCEPNLSGDDLEIFFQSKVLIITIPFTRNLPDPRYYQYQIDAIIEAVLKAGQVNFVLFTGSTSVYPLHQSVAVEDQTILPAEIRAEVLLSIEQRLLKEKAFDTTILRLGGLYGGNRKIGRILAGRTNLPNGNQPVNLIHQEDCVRIITEIIKHDIRGEIFNLVADAHPTRRELYTKAAQNMGLPAPGFVSDERKEFKIVENRKIKERLQYTFIHPDPLNSI